MQKLLDDRRMRIYGRIPLKFIYSGITHNLAKKPTTIKMNTREELDIQILIKLTLR